MECQGKMPRAVKRKAESTDVHVCGGLPRSSSFRAKSRLCVNSLHRKITSCCHFDTSHRNTSEKVQHGSLSVSMAQRFAVMFARSIPSRKIFSIVLSRKLDNALALCS